MLIETADTLAGKGAPPTIEAAIRALEQLHGNLLVGAAEPFIQAAMLVLQDECGVTVRPGRPSRTRSSITPGDWNAAVGVIGGSVAGVVLYSMGASTACRVAGKMLGERVTELNRSAQSALSELANMITGRASMGLEENGFPSHISPPRHFPAAGMFISPRPLTWISLALATELGELDVWIALRQE